MTKTDLIHMVEKEVENFIYVEPLYYCNARIYYTTNFIVLKSYSTVVACYDTDKNTFYVFNFYSTTTQQHISKFIQCVTQARFPVLYNIVYLYARSDKVAVVKAQKNPNTGNYQYTIIAKYRDRYKNDGILPISPYLTGVCDYANLIQEV